MPLRCKSEDLVAALDAYKAHNCSLADAAKSLGIARGTLHSRLEMLKRRGEVLPVRVEEKTPLQIHREVKQKRDLLDVRNRTIDEQEKEIERLAKQVEFIQELKRDDIKRGKPQVFKPNNSRAIPLLLLSDLHAEERVRPGDVAGCDNVYNVEIFKRRFKDCYQRYLYLIQTMRHMASIKTACIWLGGDLITGHIHEELMEGNAMSPINACMMVRDVINEMIEYMLVHSECDKILFPCSYGNHGRTKEKMPVQTAADHSFEWNMYKELEREWTRVAKEKRVEFIIVESYHNYVQLHDTMVRFHHGDNINYYGGVGGLTIPLNKALTSWDTIRPSNLDCFGHWHNYLPGRRAIGNGSMIGYGAYSVKVKAKFEQPQQAFALIDAKRGVTVNANIFCDG